MAQIISLFLGSVRIKKKNEFIESQDVYDNFYGTTYESINAILISGNDVVTEIDYKGMLAINRNSISKVYLYYPAQY